MSDKDDQTKDQSDNPNPDDQEFPQEEPDDAPDPDKYLRNLTEGTKPPQDEDYISPDDDA